MAAVSKKLTKQPPLPLTPLLLYEDYGSQRVVNSFTDANGDDQTRKMDVPYCPDPSDKERLLRTLQEFTDACADPRLHINGADRYVKLREVLGGSLRATWDTVTAGIDAATQADNANWIAGLRTFARNFFPNNAFTLQDEYMRAAVKPYAMDCYTLNSRIQLINQLSAYLPGSGGNTLYADDTAIKNAFYRLMLEDWQLKFDATGNALDDAAYTLQQLVDFMEQQRLHHNARMEQRSSNRQVRQNRLPLEPARRPPPPYPFNGNGYGYGPGDPGGPRYPGPPGPPRGGPPGGPRRSPYNGRSQAPQGPPAGRGNHVNRTPRRQQGSGFRSPYALRPTERRQQRFQANPQVRRNLNFYQGYDNYHQDDYVPDDTQEHYMGDTYADPHDSYDDHYHQDQPSASTPGPRAPRPARQGFESDSFQQAPAVSYDDYNDHYYAAEDDYATDDWVQDY